MNRFCYACGSVVEVKADRMAGGTKALSCVPHGHFIEAVPDYG